MFLVANKTDLERAVKEFYSGVGRGMEDWEPGDGNSPPRRRGRRGKIRDKIFSLGYILIISAQEMAA
jgi:hypothetical protein